MNDFNPGDVIIIKGGTVPMHFVGQVGNTVWVTREEPGPAVNASAYTDCTWELYRPFFEERETYTHRYMGTKVTVHKVGKVGDQKYAVGMTTGNLYLLTEEEFDYWR